MKEELISMDAKTFCKEVTGQMIDRVESWIMEKIKGVKEFPQKGLKIGCDIGMLPGRHCLCQKVLTPDGKLVLLDYKGVFYNNVDLSKMSPSQIGVILYQIERGIDRLRQ